MLCLLQHTMLTLSGGQFPPHGMLSAQNSVHWASSHHSDVTSSKLSLTFHSKGVPQSPLLPHHCIYILWSPDGDQTGLVYLWIKKEWYIHTMEHYAALKREENICHIATTWITMSSGPLC